MSTAHIKATEAMVKKYENIRTQAFNEGYESFNEELRQPNFRDFLVVYLCEGYKRNRNMVQVTNSDPVIIGLCYPFIKKWTKNKISCFVQVHHDDDQKEIVKEWGNLLDIDPKQIRVHLRAEKKSNRKGKLPYGIFTFRVGDTYLRAKLEAWISRLKESWVETLL